MKGQAREVSAIFPVSLVTGVCGLAYVVGIGRVCPAGGISGQGFRVIGQDTGCDPLLQGWKRQAGVVAIQTFWQDESLAFRKRILFFSGTGLHRFFQRVDEGKPLAFFIFFLIDINGGSFFV